MTIRLNEKELNQLYSKSMELRKTTLKMIVKANSGHIAPSFSMAEIITTLYYKILNVDPKNPDWLDRDRMVLSKGHACPILYATLADRGFFPEEWLWTLRRPGSNLQGHPDMKKLPGIDMTTGSLGNGLSAGVGMALAAKSDKRDYYTYVVLGDGELQEGLVWEGAMSAAHYQLDNLIAIIDQNGLQSGGKVESIMNLTPLDEKWKSFGWHVQEVNGHNIEKLIEAVENAWETKGRPSLIIACTTKGKGVSFMENDYMWHARVPSAEEEKKALKELTEGMKKYE